MSLTKQMLTKFANSPEAFREALYVDCNGNLRKLGEVQDEWQRDDFTALDGMLQVCNGRSESADQMRAWLERPRGHSKTTDVAVCCVWALAFANRPIKAYVYAADRDQARILHDAISTLIRCNPWLSQIIKAKSHDITNNATGHPGYGSQLSSTLR